MSKRLFFPIFVCVCLAISLPLTTATPSPKVKIALTIDTEYDRGVIFDNPMIYGAKFGVTSE